ncbi:unnamed protein product [Ilex paraguariensis]
MQEKRNKFLCLYESVHSLSTTSALKLFNDKLTNKSVEHNHNAESSSHTADLHDQRGIGELERSGVQAAFSSRGNLYELVELESIVEKCDSLYLD